MVQSFSPNLWALQSRPCADGTKATDEEIEALNAKAKQHFDRTESEGREHDNYNKNKNFRPKGTTGAYGLFSAAPEELSKLWGRKIFLSEAG
jgi:hypothetical protein